ncbi:MAG: DUF5011 domain-containing protein [Bacteroidia bacterium]
MKTDLFTTKKLRIPFGKKFSALLAATLLSGAFAEAQYCTSNATVSADSECARAYLEGDTKTLDVSKTGSGCDNYTDNTGTVMADLTAGEAYTITLENGTCGGNYTRYGNAWIDYNQDGDFDDAGEMLGKGTTGSSANGYVHVITFTVPCNIKSGSTRLRAIVKEGTNTAPCGTYAYGETEDYTISLGIAGTLAAGFYMPDTAYIKTRVSLVNNNQDGYFYHGWDIEDNGTIDATSTNLLTTFTTGGKHCVRLFSENCLGRDSALKCVQIITPTAPPVADFVATSNRVDIFSTFNLRDLSTNGPIYWEWFMYQEADSAGTHIDITAGSTYADQNPEVFTAKGVPGFPDVGKWSIGLIASNDIGSSQVLIKHDYVEVVKGCDVEMGPGTITGIPGNVITCTAGTLMSKTDGTGNYSKNEANLDALVAPCGATSITFTFDKWLVKTGVNLKVYDGQDATGKPLHPKNGFTPSDTPSGPITATSGAMYFLWNSGTAQDKGFLGHWTSTIGSQAPPVASFDVADTLYNNVWSTFVNTSQNATGEVFYTWEVDGSVESNSKDMENIFFSNTTYNVCLTVETCAGKNKSCKNVVVAPITSKTKLDFTADNRRPKAGDKVNFETMADKANSFKWTFFPGTGVSYADGTNENSKNPVVTFNSPGKYTVSLKAWNNLSFADSAASYNQIIKDQYVVVISYCTPVIGVTQSADVAINYFALADASNNKLIENSSDEGTYTDYTEEFRAAQLTFGGTYNVTVGRNTTANVVNRKVWIDYNIDGDFEDANELVLVESASQNKSVSGSFTVPDLVNAFEGVTRMRVGISYNNDPNMSCGANSGVSNANRIGEFEDYPIVLANDNTTPYILLNGNDTVYVEVKSTYTDAGAQAFDPTEGDITGRMTSSNDVDVNEAGIYYVTYCVTDASGNAAPCVTRVVYVVVDQSAPVLTLKGQNPVYLDVITDSYTEAGWTAVDVTDGNLETAVQVSGAVNTFKIGTYTLTYSVQDAQGNKATAKRNVIVRDRVFPTITNDDMYAKAGRNVVNVQLQSVFVDRTIPSDNYNNGTFGPMFHYEITPANAQGEADVDTRTKGTTIVTYKVTDESGNETSLVIDYVVEDYIKPVISLNTLDTVYHPVNHSYTPVEASVSDNLYDNTQISLTRTSNVNPYKLGLYTDTYTATDASGNVAVRNRWVRVEDRESPVISSKVGPIVKLGIGSNVLISQYLQYADNYDGPAVLRSNLNMTFNDLNTYEEGLYAVVFETSDNSGNVSTPYTIYVDVKYKYEPISSGIEDIAASDLMNVYPNPSNGVFNVKVDLPAYQNVEIAIYDVLGNKVAEVANEQAQNSVFNVDLSAHAAGMYFVRMTTNGKTYNQRVVVE